jgi:parallel beta-helix repeat protein
MGTIERNYVPSGIKAGNATIQNNTIGGIIVEGSSSPTIIYNNFDGGVSVRMASASNINAANNWWGTTNTSLIDQKIWDYTDDFTLGTVNFVPFLAEPNPQALPEPTAVVTPSPTPTPTSTSVPTQSATPPPLISQNPTASPDQSSTQGISIAEFYTVIAVLVLVITVLSAVIVVLVRRKKR